MTKKPVRQEGLTYVDPVYKYPAVIFGIYLSRVLSLFPRNESKSVLRVLQAMEVIGKEFVEFVFYGKKRDKYTTPNVIKDTKKVVVRRMVWEKNRLKKEFKKKQTRAKLVHDRFLQTVFNILPINIKWKVTQRNYVRWTKQSLPGDYIEYIKDRGKQFATFVGSPGRCLDVGCGTGIIGGGSCKRIGYTYMNKDHKSYVVGIDPLPLMGPKPEWLDEYRVGVCENLPFGDDVFDKVVVATTLDHVLNPKRCLEECVRVTKRYVYIWSTIVEVHTFPDTNHTFRFSEDQLKNLVREVGMRIIECKTISENPSFTEIFIEAEKDVKK